MFSFLSISFISSFFLLQFSLSIFLFDFYLLPYISTTVLYTQFQLHLMPEPDAEPEKAKPKKSYVSVDDLYRRSSQFQIWSYPELELEELKIQANEKGRQAALKRFDEARLELERENPDVFAKHGAELAEIAEIVSYQEEQKYLYFFSQQIIQICSHFNMPTQVKATAVAFFKRFYLVNSVMEYRPRNVLYTVVFLAAKLENYFISIESFCSRLPKTSASDILDLEFIVLLALKFTLLVHHPYRPLYGFFLDFQLVFLHPPVRNDVTIDTIGGLYDKAKAWLNDEALLSEASFLFTPPQIALAAMYDVDQQITEEYLRRKFLKEDEKLGTIKEEKEEQNGAEKKDGEEKTDENGKQNDENTQKAQYDTLVRTIQQCIQVAKTKLETSRDESTKIDKKCFFALKPANLLKKRVKALTSE